MSLKRVNGGLEMKRSLIFNGSFRSSAVRLTFCFLYLIYGRPIKLGSNLDAVGQPLIVEKYSSSRFLSLLFWEKSMNTFAGSSAFIGPSVQTPHDK
jgi:hypothetical protein